MGLNRLNVELENYNNQARIQAEHYSSKNYADRVLEVYNRAIKEKKSSLDGVVLDKLKSSLLSTYKDLF